MLKLLWITSEYHPRVGGLENYVETMVDHLGKHFDVGLVTGPNQSPKPRQTVEHLGAVNLSSCETTSQLNSAQQTIRQLARDFRPDVIHLASAGLAAFAPVLKDIASIFCTVHCKDLTRPWQKVPGSNVAHAIEHGLMLCQKVFCVSNYTKLHLQRLVPKANAEVFLHGIDIPACPGSPAPVVESHTPHILTVGRMIERKAHCLLARALEKVTMPFHWDVVGTGPVELNLRDQIAGSVIRNRVTFHGLVDDRSLQELFMQATFHALIPIEIVDDQGVDGEGFGLVYLEAAKHCKASVGSRAGGPAEAIVEGVTGLLVDPWNEADIVDAFQSLLRSKSLCTTMGVAAYTHARSHFALAERIAALVQYYEAAAQ
jgi:glycosyltransferase involved in cell wall biosynthesis